MPEYRFNKSNATSRGRGSCQDKTKASGFRFAFICEHVHRRIIQINCIPRQRELADIGTVARARQGNLQSKFDCILFLFFLLITAYPAERGGGGGGDHLINDLRRKAFCRFYLLVRLSHDW
jgi:hypothetical protein